MAINADNFTYLGYTEGEKGKPTLYFKEGRFTQVHKNPDNIGWHPRKSGEYYAKNISKAKAEEYGVLRTKKRQLREEIKELKKKSQSTDSKRKALDLVKNKIKEFSKEFMRGGYNDDGADSKYFECYKNGDEYNHQHPSRSKFIALNDTDFDKNYDESYAKGILKKEDSKMANNEN